VLPETSRGDQRAKDRYPITLELQYKLLDKGRVERVGVGRTVNISSNGVLIETDRSLPTGGSVELAMKWPFLLRGICGMKLVVRGRIVRCHANMTATAVRAESHEFRTAGFRVPRDESSMVYPAANPCSGTGAKTRESSGSRSWPLKQKVVAPGRHPPAYL
jgi:hypothetical protein